jgi:hypothetical protein
VRRRFSQVEVRRGRGGRGRRWRRRGGRRRRRARRWLQGKRLAVRRVRTGKMWVVI